MRSKEGNAVARLQLIGLWRHSSFLKLWAGQTIGLQRTLVIAAFGEMLACVWLLFSPVKRLRQQPAPGGLD
jgi:hypothetical protein